MRTRTMAAASLGLAVILAACGSGAATPAPATSAPATPAPATAAPASDAPSQPAAAGDVAVGIASTSLGDILVDGDGMTLYVFTPDNAGDPTCYDDCETAWPILAGTGVTAGDGLDAADFGTTSRTDGKSQITFNGWPLYFFAGDAAAGDTAGQGVGGKWFVVTADGSMVK